MVLEAERPSDAVRMDRHYRYQRYIYDATRTHYLLGRRTLIRGLAPEPGQTVLEIGCGTAWNLVRVAKTYPQARCFGLDVSNAMLATARRSVERHGLADRIALRQGDATAFDAEKTFGVARFDRVFFSYALSMIPDWRRALDLAAGHVAPGGTLSLVDFGQCEDLPEGFRRALFAFLAHYTVTPRHDLEAAVYTTAEKHGLAASFERRFRGYANFAVLTRDR